MLCSWHQFTKDSLLPLKSREKMFAHVGSIDVGSMHIGVRDQFRLGGLRSVARIFYPLLARKSSGFARILHDFLPEYGYLKNSMGGCSPPSPPPPPPASYAYEYASILGTKPFVGQHGFIDNCNFWKTMKKLSEIRNYKLIYGNVPKQAIVSLCPWICAIRAPSCTVILVHDLKAIWKKRRICTVLYTNYTRMLCIEYTVNSAWVESIGTEEIALT